MSAPSNRLFAKQTLGWVMAGVVASAVVVTACILPHRIQATDENRSNRHPVRIVDAMLLPPEADDACIAKSMDLDECPQPGQSPETVLPKLLDPNKNVDYEFCSCPEGQRDSRAQNAFAVYIEDRDGADSLNYDILYAALLLDYDPSRPVTEDIVRYQSYIDPEAEVPPPLSLADEQLPLGRPDPLLRRLQLGNSATRVDLCNASGSGPLAPGLHTLTLMVTDKPWFTEELPFEDEDSETGPPTVETAGIQEVSHPGVPDLANGASFDTVTYTFNCFDHATAGELGVNCGCEEQDEEDE